MISLLLLTTVAFLIGYGTKPLNTKGDALAVIVFLVTIIGLPLIIVSTRLGTYVALETMHWVCLVQNYLGN